MNTTPRFPTGWDDARVREVIGHYENQTDEEAAAEHEAALAEAGVSPLPLERVRDFEERLAGDRGEVSLVVEGAGVADA